MDFVAAGTWRFAMPGIETAIGMLKAGSSAMDAAEAAVRVVEDDESVESVGVGGGPNAEGVMELDAAVMDGQTLSMGAVAALRGIRHPVSVARKLLATPHTFLAGEGAQRFALANGFIIEDILTEAAKARWLAKKAEGGPVADGHDTVCFIIRDASGHFVTATSTSGLFYKMPGRVGDTPLPGCGFYSDDQLGAAVATGVGEDLMRGAVSHRALMLMAQGLKPPEAAATALKNVVEKRAAAGYTVKDVSLLVMSKDGEVAAATNRPEGFPYAIGTPHGAQIMEVMSI